MHEDDAAHWVGKTFAGTWKIDRVLGAGGMGSVPRGRSADSSKAALKVLHPELYAIAEVRKRFLREGFLGNELGEAAPLPGIARMLDGLTGLPEKTATRDRHDPRNGDVARAARR